MSELTRKRIRYEILEDIEGFLRGRINALEENIEWNESQTDESGEIPGWRQDEIQKERDKISEMTEVIKLLPKLG